MELKENPSLGTYGLSGVQESYIKLLSDVLVETDKLQYQMFGQPDFPKMWEMMCGGQTPNNMCLMVLDSVRTMLFSLLWYNDIPDEAKSILNKYMQPKDPKEMFRGNSKTRDKDISNYSTV